jgi:hypothetical protein
VDTKGGLYRHLRHRLLLLLLLIIRILVAFVRLIVVAVDIEAAIGAGFEPTLRVPDPHRSLRLPHWVPDVRDA